VTAQGKTHQHGRPARTVFPRAGMQRTYDTVFALLRASYSPSAEALDIPCGIGVFTERLLDARYNVIAADLAKHPDVPDVPFHILDMDKPLPFETDAFDAVCSIEGIEHIRRPFDFIKECRRIIRPGGRLFITTPNISSLRSRWRWLLTGFHSKCKHPLEESAPALRHHINMLSFPSLRYMLHTNGFRIETITTNRIRPINWLYAPWAPVQYLATRLALGRGAKNQEHREQIAETRKQMMSLPILFGETMVVVAKTAK